MWPDRRLLDLCGIEHPIVQAPMAGAMDVSLAIAVALREAEDQGKHAALVTPDRALARRVVAALERWRVPVDDSGGDNLADTSAGRFARLAAEAALNGLEPVTLLALRAVGVMDARARGLVVQAGLPAKALVGA